MNKDSHKSPVKKEGRSRNQSGNEQRENLNKDGQKISDQGSINNDLKPVSQEPNSNIVENEPQKTEVIPTPPVTKPLPMPSLNKHDQAMLCFYEGEDCMDDPGDPSATTLFPEPVPAMDPTLFPEPVPAMEQPALDVDLDSIALPESSSPQTPTIAPQTSNIAPQTPIIAPQAPNIIPQAPTISTQVFPQAVKSNGMDLTKVHPITAVHEFCRRMGYPQPLWEERRIQTGTGSAWAFDVTVGPTKYSMLGNRTKKKDAQKEGAIYCLFQLGIKSRHGISKF